MVATEEVTTEEIVGVLEVVTAAKVRTAAGVVVKRFYTDHIHYKPHRHRLHRSEGD